MTQALKAMFAGLTLLLASASMAAEATPGSEGARIQALAEEATIYGLPLVMDYAVMYSYAVDSTSRQFKAPFNQLHNEARVLTHKDTVIVTPNSDTPYSIAWLDLRAEPVVVTVPAVAKPRYYSAQFTDGNTFNYGLVSTLATGREAGHYLAVGPDWKGTVPKGIKAVFRSSTRFSLVLFRTQLFGADDIGAVKAVQAGYQVRSLSAFSGSAVPSASTAVEFPKIDKDLAKTNFFAYLDFLLQFAPPGAEEKVIRDKLATLGIGTGNFDRFKALAATYRRELALGMKAGDEKINQAIATAGERRNGWLFPKAGGGPREHYAGDWLRRAALAKAGIYAMNASEALYPMTRTLDNGELIDASKHRYTLTFAPGQLPPANAFWSLTMYDGNSQFLVDNPLQRYLISSVMLPTLRRNTDGSITLYLQHGAPDADKVSNWLPAPNGPVYLVMRLYGPHARASSGAWRISPVVLAK